MLEKSSHKDNIWLTIQCSCHKSSLHFKKKYQPGLLNVYIDNGDCILKSYKEEASRNSTSSRSGVRVLRDPALFAVLAVVL